ncbi:uncharacterized protein [Henckelia pumila]|uniref:uncharacterized protein n=1 Tax=Henckelia pumila TaxID=405737 RepID=UPI003C6E9DA9
MEEGANPLCQPQRKLNPPMMEVVKAEIIKLLEVGVIYPISDNQCVSPVQVVPKKIGITVVKNKDDELIAIAPEDQEKMTFTCPFGTFAYRQVFMYDFTVYGDSFDKCLSNLDLVLKRFLEGIYSGLRQDFIFHVQTVAKDVPFEFDDSCKASFDKLKDSLTSAPIIQPPDWSKPFEIMCDASDYAVGVVLGQKVGKASHAIYYALRILNDAQRNYYSTDKELLAKEAKPRLIRWILLLSEFDVKTKDKRGAYNRVADHSSRLIHIDEELSLQEEFPDEQLFSASTVLPWYAHIVNYLVTKGFPSEFSKAQRDKVRSDAKYFVWNDPYLWKHCADQVIQRCVPASEVIPILTFCHSYACGGHFGAKRIARKMDDSGEHRKLQLQELEEIRNEAYVSSKINKEKTNAFHDKMISRREFKVVEIQSLETSKIFKVNGQRLKHYHEGVQSNDGEDADNLTLDAPPDID